MKYSDFEKFFEQHIEKFLPFYDQITYQELVKFLKDSYFKESYTTIPANFKSLLEEQVIPSDVYSPILLSLGFSTDIVRNCTVIQKEILLKQFGDYNRYKGSRYILDMISSNFKQRINMYELFIDNRNNDWHFLPSLIYSNAEVPLLSELLDYNEIINQTKHFLITKPQLTVLQSAGKIVLPIKSNILYIQAELNLYIGYIENIIFTTVFHNYYNKPLFYYSNDEIFPTTILGLFQLWEYLIMRKTGNAGFPAISKTNLIFLDSGSDNDPNTTPYSLVSTDVNYIEDTLVAEFNKITTIRERDVFFSNYIKSTPKYSNKFYSVDYTTVELTLNDVESMLNSPTSPVGSDLFSYVNDRLNDAFSLSQEADAILEELRNSFLVCVNATEDTIFAEYYSYLLRYLDATHPIATIDETTLIYKLLNFLKPQHTEIVTHDMSFTRVFDKFNALLLDDSYSILCTSVFYDPYVISDIYINYIMVVWEDSYVISDSYSTHVIVIWEDSYVISDEAFIILDIDEFVSALSLSDDFILSKTYDGSFTFAASNIVQTDAAGYAEFDVDDYIFSLSDTSDYAQKITNKDLPTLQLTLENTYTGTAGLVAKAWKIC